MGYFKAGFQVVGVDHKPQKNYPFQFHCADAITFALAYGDEFDVIHASPPCQAYSEATPIASRGKHPDLIAAVRYVLQSIGKPYVIENVDGARFLLRDPFFLCGTMFGLNLYRHRWFETSPLIHALVPPCNHHDNPVVISGSRHGKGESKVPEMICALDVPWMKVRNEARQAIPPAYTEWIGRQLLTVMEANHGQMSTL